MYCFRENSNFPFSNQKIITLACATIKDIENYNVSSSCHVEAFLLRAISHLIGKMVKAALKVQLFVFTIKVSNIYMSLNWFKKV